MRLEPCPFCGGDAVLMRFVNPTNFYYVECTVCHCKTDGYRCSASGTDADNKSAQAAMWNSRHPVDLQLTLF